ncbi:coiled-coil domain-containing protein 120 isoform X2 [Clupea harengus]|uniref:Coiled-coil domain-containing protein 120 isoform X2 n=1 Tax=Clupea harengus TaxID=7950 RepID=A0A6P8FKN2_CLUHA|nr:coiled-coil domain-containing protein 120 isoform X2 [Clupea harengus]
MDVRRHVVSTMGLGAPDSQDGKLQTERVCELQERKQSLQAALTSRMGELRRVCLLEAELTGKLPRDFPLEAGERPPLIQRRSGLPPHAPSHHTQDDPCQRRQMKALFGGALRRSTEADKRTVHRGCHTEETVKSESSSMSDSTSQDNESSPSVCVSVAPQQRSLSHPRLNPGSPDSRLIRKLSPVEIYYEMRTRRNSTSSSISPSHSLPRSASNVEGRSVPATPLLSRTAPISIHVRPEVSGGIALKQWCGSPDVPHFVPLASLEGSASDRRSCPYSSRARRSNSSEALLDRSSLPDGPPPRNGMPPRGGPFKSSETLTDGKLRQYRGSPERQVGGVGREQGRTRASVGGRPSGGGYNEILLDYIWGKAPSRPNQLPAGSQPAPRGWPDVCPPPFNGLSLSQLQLAAPPPYSPLLLRGAPPLTDPRRAKVTRTKSCGPFLPEPLLLSAYEPHHPPAASSAASIPTLHPHPLAPPHSRRPPLSLPTPEDSTRSLHKALALEGLRDWYLRNALGYAPSKGHAHTQPPLLPQGPPSQGEIYPPIGSQMTQGEMIYPPIGSQMTQSASFHGYPLQARSVELSRFPEPFPSQLQEGATPDPPAPGTLV